MAPLVSLGLPVRNGGRFLREALESLLDQTYRPLEVVVSDNASTDDTAEICKEYAGTGLVRYHRMDRDRGAIANFNRALELSTGVYFAWTSDHDLWQPRAVESCVALLEQDSSLALVYPRATVVDMHGTPLDAELDHIDTRGLPAAARLERLLMTVMECQLFFGVYRADALRATGGNEYVWGHDIAVLARLSLRGAIAETTEHLLVYRRSRAPEYDPDAWRRRVLSTRFPEAARPSLDRSFDDLQRDLRNSCLRGVLASPLPPREKAAAARVTLRCFQRRFGVTTPWFRARLRLGAVRRRLREAVSRAPAA
jgi:glycosyltransferase involved in cell wall biosynthesis